MSSWYIYYSFLF